MQIYIRRNGQRIGPFSLEEVNRQLASGSLNPSELAWHEVAPGWKPLFSIAGVILPGAASASLKPVGLATPVSASLPVYAGFWIRALALMIDSVILTVSTIVLWFAFWPNRVDPRSGSLFLAATAATGIKILYFAGLWASPMQATLGQKMCGLRVIRDAHDPRISFSRAVGRFLAMAASTLPLGIGYIMAGLTGRKRALHDMLAGTCVIKMR